MKDAERRFGNDLQDLEKKLYHFVEIQNGKMNELKNSKQFNQIPNSQQIPKNDEVIESVSVLRKRIDNLQTELLKSSKRIDVLRETVRKQDFKIKEVQNDFAKNVEKAERNQIENSREDYRSNSDRFSNMNEGTVENNYQKQNPNNYREFITTTEIDLAVRPTTTESTTTTTTTTTPKVARPRFQKQVVKLGELDELNINDCQDIPWRKRKPYFFQVSLSNRRLFCYYDEDWNKIYTIIQRRSNSESNFKATFNDY